MRWLTFIVSVPVLIALASCGGPVSSRTVREQIARLGGAELSPDDVAVERIIQQTSSRAVAEFTVQMAGEYVRNGDGDWELVSVRIGDNEWVDLGRLRDAIARMEIEETTASLRMLAGGVAAFRAENGAFPDVGADSLGDILHPLFVPELVRSDAWGSEFLYQTSGTTFRLVSAGPDGETGTADDIEISGP